MTSLDFSGEWLSTQSRSDEEDPSQHIVTFDGEIQLEGLGTVQQNGSLLSLRLMHDRQTSTLTGTWHEMTSINGKHRGQAFHGALQLILNSTLDRAEGKWIGFNKTYTEVNAGAWLLEKQ